MLRASSRHTARPADLRAVLDPFSDSLVPAGRELLAFTDAAVFADTAEMPLARRELIQVAGEDATVRAAAVVGNFQMMNRLLDALGVRVGANAMRLANELGLRVPTHLRPPERDEKP